MSSRVTLEILDYEVRAPASRSLPLGEPGSACQVRLRAVPGSSGLQLRVSEDGEERISLELPAHPGETLTLKIRCDAEGTLHAAQESDYVLRLPTGVSASAPPLWIGPDDGSLDLVLLIDGTMRTFQGGASELTLAQREAWHPIVDSLVAFVSAAGAGRPGTRAEVLAYGDHASPRANAEDLRPTYVLAPDTSSALRLRDLDSEALRLRLQAIPASSGGDFVDALADGLTACRTLRWRSEARKLVFLVGDSPGHSLVHPAPPGSDLLVRERDVDLEVAALHALGVERASLYFAPEVDIGLTQFKARRQLVDFAREQYRRLASVPELAFEASEFNPEEAGRAFHALKGPIGHGACIPELIDIKPGA